MIPTGPAPARARRIRAISREGAERRLRKGVRALATADPDMAELIRLSGPPPIALREHGFSTLLRAIVAQQVSAAAARAIWGRVETACGTVTPAAFMNLGEDAIRGLGFSRQKIAYGSGLADAILSGRLDMDGLARMPDEEAIAALVEMKGIGRWSAEIYLLFALGRPDVMPSLDLAIQIAAGRIKNLEARPGPKQLLALAETWRPWRSAAAIMLWHHYRTTP